MYISTYSPFIAIIIPVEVLASETANLCTNTNANTNTNTNTNMNTNTNTSTSTNTNIV